MTITSYTYKIISTNPSIGAMEVEFSAAGYPTVLVGARMPYQGEDLDSLVRTFAPTEHWENVGRQVAEVAVGHEASYAAPEPQPPTVQDQIVALERANPITHRNLRDLTMVVAQIAGRLEGVDPMVNPAVQQLAALEAQIAALREQL